MSEKEKFLQTWEREFQTTLRVLKAYPMTKVDLRPHEGSRSARELAWTFVVVESAIDGVVKEQIEFRKIARPPATLQEIVGTYEKTHNEMVRKVKDLPEEEFDKPVKIPTGPGKMGDVRRGDIFMLMVMDMVHHRGQFSVYLRMAGGKVPSIYGPTADEPWPLQQEPGTAAPRPGVEGQLPTKMFKSDLEVFRSTRAQTLAMVERVSQAQLDYSPAPHEWSVGELLDHILLAEKVFRDEIAHLIELKQAGQKPVLKRSFRDLDVSIAYIPKPLLPVVEIPFTLFNMFVPSAARELMMRYRLIPAQNPEVATPRKGRPADQLRNDLRSSLKETEALFEANPDLDYREMIDEHPLLGTNNVLQLLRLLALHEVRHQSQISDILADPRFRKVA
jgi:uncharacterized damage-inducible protein DinB